MKENSNPDNIFEVAKKRPLPSSSKVEKLEIEVMLKEVDQKQQQIKELLSDLYQQSGYTPEGVTNYLNDRSNFTEMTWSLIQQQREQMLSQIPPIGGKSAKEAIKAEERKKGFEKRKGKTLGLRKNWLSM